MGLIASRRIKRAGQRAICRFVPPVFCLIGLLFARSYPHTVADDEAVHLGVIGIQAVAGHDDGLGAGPVLHNAAGQCLGAGLVLHMVDDDLTARKALGFHSVDDLVEHLLFASRVPHEFDFTGLTRRAQNAYIELVGNDAGCLRDTSGFGEIFVIAQAEEDFAVLFKTIEVWRKRPRMRHPDCLQDSGRTARK